MAPRFLDEEDGKGVYCCLSRYKGPVLDFPSLLKKLHELEFDNPDGDGIEFEPYPRFMAPDATTEWLRAWTSNQQLTATDYLVFGQDGSGGYAAFWLARDGEALLQQPIVFFGSEGETGVVAANFDDYLWLLAQGIGPMEAVEYGADHQAPANRSLQEFAQKHTTSSKKAPNVILSRAKDAFPDFESMINSLCK